MSDVDEKRRSDRYPVSQPAAIRRAEGEAEAIASMSNLSLGGARLRLEVEPALTVGEAVVVSFSIPTLPTPLVAKARVRWRSEVDRHSVGVQFVTGFRARETWALGRYLDTLPRAE